MGRFDNEITNPAVKTLKWKSKLKSFVYYDKDAEEEVQLDFPIKDLVYLEDLTSFSGYNKASNGGIWSNEIKDLDTQEMTVRTKQGEVVKGLYHDIKAKALKAGAKYTKVVYFLAGNEIWKVLLSGGAFGGVSSEDTGKGKNVKNDWFDNYAEDYGKNTSGWINFWKQCKREINKYGVSITESLIAHGTLGDYNVPFFTIQEDTEIDPDKTKEAYDSLWAYLKDYFKANESEESILESEEDSEEEEKEEELDSLDDIFGKD